MGAIELSGAIRRSHALCAATIVLLLGSSGVVLAEDLAPFPNLPDAAGSVDEVIVRAKTLQRLQVEVFRAEDAFYDAFNAANSDHQFDIHCEFRAYTGTHITQRVCRADFVAKLEAQATQALMRGDPAPPTYGMMLEKGEKLRQEMRSAATERPEVLAARVNIASARQSFEAEKARRCGDKALFCRRH